jgi:hypothetical protein
LFTARAVALSLWKIHCSRRLSSPVGYGVIEINSGGYDRRIPRTMAFASGTKLVLNCGRAKFVTLKI